MDWGLLATVLCWVLVITLGIIAVFSVLMAALGFVEALRNALKAPPQSKANE